jgi:hypothetical protein
VTDPEAPVKTAAPAQHGIAPRSIAAVVALILGLGLLPLSTVSYWGNRTISDAQRYIETVGPLANSPEVQDSISTFLSNKIEQQVDPTAVVQEAFGGLLKDYPSLRALVPIVAGAIDALIKQVVDRLVRSDAFKTLWDIANTAAQRSLLALLEGDPSGPVTLQGDEVVLDVSNLLDEVKAGLVARGFQSAERINFPAADRQIVLLEAPQVAQLRTIYALTSTVAAALIYVVALLLLLAIVLARRRPRMVAWVGGGVMGAAGVLIIGLGIGQTVFVNTLTGTPLGPASQVFYEQLLTFLYGAAYTLVFLGLVLLVVGLYLCGARWAVELRASINTQADDIAGTIPTGPITTWGVWVAENARWLRIGVAVLFTTIVIIGQDLSLARTIWAAVIALILLAIIQVWAAAGRRTPVEQAPVEQAPVEQASD